VDFPAFAEWTTHFRVRDAFDIALVAVLCYAGLVWLKGHASQSLLVAAIALLSLYGLARWFDLYLTSLLFQAGALAILLALLLIFQEDLRRAAEHFVLHRGRHAHEQASLSTVDLVVETVRELAEDRIGALIVFPGREPLDRVVRGGEALHGVLSRSLLVSLFHPQSPGHDGAAVIQGDVLTRFAVHLPLSRFPDKVGREGTRHAAGLGLAENSDALVVVVSEERGTVSVAQQGEIDVIEPSALKERLEHFLSEAAPQPTSEVVSRWLIHNPGLKLTSLLLATLLWIGLAHRVETVQRQYPAPIEYRNLPAGWAIDETRAFPARVTLSGSERDFDRFDPTNLVISLDLAQPREGTVELPIASEQVVGAESLTVTDIEPKSVRLEAYRVSAYTLPVRVRLRNELPGGLRLARVEAQPAQIQVQAPAAQQGRLEAIETEAVDLSRLDRTKTFRLHLELPPRVRLAENQPVAVEATLYVEPVAASKD
jgi:uncharacterized protein (TIGR00159 family)